MKLRVCIFYGALMINGLMEKGEAMENLQRSVKSCLRYTPHQIYFIRDKMTKEQLNIPEGSPEGNEIEELKQMMEDAKNNR